MSSFTPSKAKVIPISDRATLVPPQRFKSQSFIQSVGFAVSGLRKIFETERNFRTHLVIAALVIAAGVSFQVSIVEWGILILCMGIMISVEALNTAVEYTVDLMTGGIYHEKAKHAKDAAAGACLVTAIAVAITGICVFAPHIFGCLSAFLKQPLPHFF